MTSARVREIFRDEKKKEILETLEGKPGSTRKKVGSTRVQKIPEPPVKQLKDMGESSENSMKNVEVEEELGKERDHMDDRKKMPEGRKNSFEKSSDCNNNTAVWTETTSCENELAADRKLIALELDHSLVSLDRQKKARLIDRATSPIKLTQSKSEGKFSVLILMKTICLRLREYSSLDGADLQINSCRRHLRNHSLV